MRLTVFFMFCFIVGGHATGLSQYRLSMKLGDTTFKQLFEEIRKQTGCIVMYSDDMLDKNERVKADFSDESLEQVLDVVLAGKGLRYEKNAEFITIMKAVLPQATEARTITGKVKDTQGNTVPGVSVFIKGTTVGVATDADGLFKLTIPEQKDIVLVFSFVGMKTQEVALKNQKEINIVMEEDAKVMDEVVVTGIFERKKEGFTGSATTVTGEEIKKLTSNNVLRALSMIDPGFRMNVSNVAGSNPNALPDFEMRGQANMGNYDGEDVVIMRGDIDTRPNQPLFVLDGIIGVGISTIIDLDPDRIESITILKDAAAMVVYGSRASNGVVVVETKAPEKGKLRFSYSGNYKYQTPDLSVYHLLNAADKLELERQAGYYDERYTASNASNLQNFYLAKYLDVQRGVNTDWIAQPVRTAFNHRHSFNLEGGDNTLRYKLYFGINQAPGVMKGTGVDTKSGSIDLRYRTNKLLVSNQLSIDFTVGDRTSPYGTFQTYTMLNPYYRIYDENGAISKVLDNHVYSTDGYVSYIGGYSTPTMNPMYNIQFHQKDQNKQFQVRNSFRAEYTPIESLRISADITLTKTEEDLEQFKPSSHTDFEGLAVEDRGSYNWTHNKGTNYNVSLTASYNKVFNSDHLVSVFARYDIDERYTHAAGVNVKGFPNDKMDEVFLGNEPTTTSGDEGTNRSIGFVSTVTTEFIGAIMDLCQERRGIYNGMDYIEETRALLKYDLPLNEIIYDFFDALKSRSRGYASFDYEFKGYVQSELVKLDILINKEEVDALSFIVHKDSAYERGRKMCEKLKDEIPRHLFEIPIQAAVGGKIIARETVRAMRKDVLAKCYGGDISRKKKLLEKQKEGKKRMRQIGNVEISQKAFISILKLDDK